MVYLPPPHLAGPATPSYADAYARILAAHRRSPSTSASAVTILIAPDVDALCAARMLADLLKQDDVVYSIVPVSGIDHLENIKDNLVNCAELHTLILFNMGSILDLPSQEWFGEFEQKHLSVHVIDSTRPQNLSSLFGEGQSAQKIVVWDDGEADKLEEERKAWHALVNNPEEESDSENDSDLESDPATEHESDEDGEYEASEGRKRKSPRDGRRKSDKRRRTTRLSRDEREHHSERIQRHYTAGTWFGQSASTTIFLLATVLERVDNDMLWLAIMGLTYQYITSRISRSSYDKYQTIYHDEVSRLNPSNEAPKDNTLPLLNPDDSSVRATEELRFLLFRHWTLYDAMLHSSYVASKLGIWKDRGRKRLTGLLAKMGFSLKETQERYAHMDLKLKRTLLTQLKDIAPEYGLVELLYPSFVRSFGYKSRPMSAADAVEAVSALLCASEGLKVAVEIEGARNGGEWFGGGRVWEKHTTGGSRARRRDDERENIPPDGVTAAGKTKAQNADDLDSAVEPEKEVSEEAIWQKNFWNAFDALNDSTQLQSALDLSMSLHRDISLQGTAIIDKHSIKTMRNHRVVILNQGPSLHLFCQPGILSRLALWLVDALRDRVEPTHTGRRGKRSLPVVVGCLNEANGTYLIVGVMAAAEFGDIRKNEFGLAFLDAKERCNARTRHGSFDTSILEINQADLKVFLETLCETAEGY